MTFLFTIAVLVICLVGFSTGTDCPNKWVAFNGKCYYFPYNSPMSFYEAEHFCRQHHESHLVHVENALQNAFIKDILTGQKAEGHWFGATDEIAEGIWQWYDTNTQLNFTDWYPGQLVNDRQDCGVFWPQYGYRWGDIECSYTGAQPICQITVEQGAIVG